MYDRDDSCVNSVWIILHLAVLGPDPWPPGCCLHFLAGVQFGTIDRVMVDALQPGEQMNISINMTSPAGLGIHQGQWRMQSPAGMYFGGV